ncbi:hypothetical protein [Streptomyces longwoodensis]|uniref:hypothetical protein n=1 Tax=Streptomyces longwoodensis TaxID=68231 RepID=UPI002255026F|nr:hypothetical protein [Streptomyces longwoodensis]MCX5000946.1 hypothetical protein [Streptomyces longwoodensis]
MTDFSAAINEAIRNGTPLPMSSRAYKRVPVREPQPLCLCGHRRDGHGRFADGNRDHCWACRCKDWQDSGRIEDPDQIPYRLVPDEGDEVT